MSLYRSAESLLQARINRRTLAAGTGASLALTGLGKVGAQDSTPEGEPFKVAFIYVGPVGDGGYTYAHDQGRIALQDALPNVETAFIENIPEVQADVERAVRGYAEEGYNAGRCHIVRVWTGRAGRGSAVPRYAIHPHLRVPDR